MHVLEERSSQLNVCLFRVGSWIISMKTVWLVLHDMFKRVFSLCSQIPLLIAPPLDIAKLNGQKLGLDGDHQYLNAGLAVSLCHTWLKKIGHSENIHLDGNVSMHHIFCI